ncbi:MAG: hypothetical protein WCC90_12300, partial [Methylocella sp.]
MVVTLRALAQLKAHLLEYIKISSTSRISTMPETSGIPGTMAIAGIYKRSTMAATQAARPPVLEVGRIGYQFGSTA